MADTAPVQKMPPALRARDLRGAEYERGSYFAIVPSETTFEEVMMPAFWQHHVKILSGGDTLRPFARVEVVREDGTMDLDLRVLECKPGMVRMRCLRKFVSDENIGKPAKGAPQPGDDVLKMPAGYTWAHVPRGENSGHMVRLAGGEVLAKGLPSKKDAVAVARKHLAEATTVPADAG